MISQLRGTVVARGEQRVIIDVSGVGLSVSTPNQTALSLDIGEQTLLHTTLIVREDSMSLTGFAREDERDVFELLLGVSGVGPKSALGVLGQLSVDDIALAIQQEDDEAFRRVSGIGPKTAKLIVLALAGRVGPSEAVGGTSAVDAAVSRSDQSTIVQALVGLGWSERVAKKGVQEVMDSLAIDEQPSVADMVKRALQFLGPQTTREDSR